MVGDGETYHQQQDTKFATSKFRSLSKNLRRPTYQTELQSKYVLVPADKAGNNIIFVCKYHYIRTLMEELGINSGTILNSTYINQANTVDELIQTHATTLADVFNIKLQQKEKNLPQIYWIPKLHKTPYKARFIAGSRSCTTTRISKLITECLKLVRSHCTAYCKTIRERTGDNSMWIINNSLDVIRTLEEKQLSLTHVSTWDFSTLYTSLPHARLKNHHHDLLERVFHTKGKSFIATNPFRTFWTNDRTSMRYTYFSCRELCLAIDFLIDNIYVRFGSSGRLLVYQWASIVPLCWLISSFIPSSTISWSKQ